ncbi:MAG: FixH family protein [Cytophagales bacterium]|nr:FixH family protein [Bernardetiaceae bacterium]MDW8211222.1 FixH family protein [Cytophagales bacterium]
MKFHWGHGVIVAFICFGLMIGYMVTMAMRANIPMVSKDYYRQEQHFDAHAAAVQHARQAGTLLGMQQQENELVFYCPKEWKDRVKGEIYFYRPSDARLDFKIPFLPDSQGKQVVPINQLAKGYWHAKMQLTDRQKAYFKDYAFYIK